MNMELTGCPIECPAEVIDAVQKLLTLMCEPLVVTSGEELERYEREVREQTDRVCALVVGHRIQFSLDSEQLQELQGRWVKAFAHKLKNKGKERVRIRTITGMMVEVIVSYFTRKNERRGKRRWPGLYPALQLLGIHDRCTPALAAQVSLLAAMVGSLEEASNVLAEQGIKLNTKIVRRIAYRFAERARVVQRLEAVDLGDQLTGRRVAVSMDGGRIRIREKKRGPKTAKGRNRYHGAWREPKLLIVYVVDGEGKLERSFMPVIDALIGRPDALFKLLQGYLEQLGLIEADRVLFIADGAPWIWHRIPDLIARLGLKPEQTHELIDFYHAVEHLGKVAALRKSWSPKQRRSWVLRQRKRLLQDQVAKVVAAVQEICRGRNSKEIRTQRNYFVKNAARMSYARMRSLNMPIGSGCVESAIRRVVNLRLKGPCTFWCKANAEAVLLLRCYWKAGRWNLLKKMANSFVSEAYA
jgi:hypothetical protein